nr:uncharacterized protein LOC115268093 [Aedes albopictus]
MQSTATLCFTGVIVSLLAWWSSSQLANAAGWFTPQYPPVVEFGQYNPSDEICFHRKILDGTHSPHIIHFRHPVGASINYIKLQSTQNKWARFRAELTDGAIGTSFVQLELYATYSWLFFRTDVFIDMHCTPVPKAFAALLVRNRKRPQIHGLTTSKPRTLSTKRTVYWV